MVTITRRMHPTNNYKLQDSTGKTEGGLKRETKLLCVSLIIKAKNGQYVPYNGCF